MCHRNERDQQCHSNQGSKGRSGDCRTGREPGFAAPRQRMTIGTIAAAVASPGTPSTIEVMSPAAVLTAAAAVSSTIRRGRERQHGWQQDGERRGSTQSGKDADDEPDGDSGGEIGQRRPLQQLLQAERQRRERALRSTPTENRLDLVERLASRREQTKSLLRTPADTGGISRAQLPLPRAAAGRPTCA